MAQLLHLLLVNHRLSKISGLDALGLLLNYVGLDTLNLHVHIDFADLAP
jgi:hypothetical protein